MKRSLADLSYDELGQIAAEAWSEAARDALAEGHAVSGRVNGRLARVRPDGQVEILETSADRSATPVKPKLRTARRA